MATSSTNSLVRLVIGFWILTCVSPWVWAQSPATIQLQSIGTYASAIFDQSAAEISAHDPVTQRLFVVNVASGKIDVLDIHDPTQPDRVFSIDLASWGKAANSVAVSRGLVAVAVEHQDRTQNGQLVLFNTDGDFIAGVEVGALPDMVIFTPNGRHILVANEGEPSDDYLIDPEGSVSIIDLPANPKLLHQGNVRTATFTRFNTAKLDDSIRIFGPGASVAQDLEPEYIAVSNNSRTAWVSLQENNAIAILDIRAGEFTELLGLGFKNHALQGYGLDPSDRDDQIAIRNWPVMGMYQPDAIAVYRHRGRNYLVTANEGDARDYDGFSETVRFRSLTSDTPICQDSVHFNRFFADNPYGITNLEDLRDNANLGRLTVTRSTGLRADQSCYETIHAFGARSFSIWDANTLQRVFDSGEDMERITAQMFPDYFNSNHRENSLETRSDDKGPEPEGVVVARLWGKTYAFIGMERVGGIFVYDISNPLAAKFVQYLNNRDFTAPADTAQAGDLGPEGLIVIEAGKSPIPGVPLLVVSNEVSGTTTLFRIDRILKRKHHQQQAR